MSANKSDEEKVLVEVKDGYFYFIFKYKVSKPRSLGEFYNKPIEQGVAVELECHPEQILKAITQWKVSPKLSLEQVKNFYSKLLCLEKPDGIIDEEIIDVLFAFACDRKIAGDPTWLFLEAASGGAKTELIRSLDKWEVYTLDTLTPRTLISGKVKDTTGQPTKGILPKIDGKVLCVKDFTVILKKRREDRDEIFSQFRAVYDGYFNGAYGNFEEPIRIKANIGCIFGVTTIIDKYTSVHSLVGERFLKFRIMLHERKVVQKAVENQGNEEEIREELSTIANLYLRNLDFSNEPKISKQIQNALVELSLFVAKMRTVVHAEWVEGYEKIIVNEPESEYGTRLVKQFQKLVKLLAIIRGHNIVTWEDYFTVRRVGEDTCYQPRIKIIKVFLNQPKLTTAEIQRIGKFRTFPPTKRKVQDLEALGILRQNEEGQWKITDSFQMILTATYPKPQTTLSIELPQLKEDQLTETYVKGVYSINKENTLIPNTSVNVHSRM